MLRGGVSVNVAKRLVKGSHAEFSTKDIVDKTKKVVQNAAETTKNMAAAAAEKIMDSTSDSNSHRSNKSSSNEKHNKGDHRMTMEEAAAGEANAGVGPQVGTGDKMHDRAGKAGRVNEPNRRH